MSATKYKVGDKVRVRSDLSEEKEYGKYCITHDMAKLKGKKVTIEEISVSKDPKLSSYKLSEFEFPWFTDEMFEDITPEETAPLPKPIFKVGDKVVVKKVREGDESDYPYNFCDIMIENYGGKTLTIKSIEHRTKSIYSDRKYFGDGWVYKCFENSYWWISSMFEPVKEAFVGERQMCASPDMVCSEYTPIKQDNKLKTEKEIKLTIKHNTYKF